LHVAVAATLPALAFVIANVLEHEIGVSGATTWLDPMLEAAVPSALLTIAITLGPFLAVVLATSWLLPFRVARDDDAWQVTVRVRIDPLAIAVLGVSICSGAALFAYVVIENAACLFGSATSC
jgi:hypothetical protein